MSNNHSCHYWKDLFAVDLADAEAHAVADLLNGLDFPDVIDLGFEDLATETGISEEGCRLILADIVKVFRVSEGTDPKDVTDALRGRGIVASPIYAVGPLGHSGFMQGTLPQGPLPAQSTPPPDFKPEKPVIAMVDTGIAVQEDEERPEWPSSDAVMFDPEDEDTEPTDGHSHGTFVASIIRRIAPDHQLIVARAEEMELDNLMPDDHEGDHDGPSKLTTELHIADALRRLRERTHGKKVASLNLSLGAYICDTNDDLLITMRNALRFWKVQHPSEKCDEDGNVVGTTIFAAGGNRDLSDPVYPAAFPYVRGVAAAICDVPPGDVEKDVVWKKGDASPKNADPRWWITDVAPGVDLVGNTDMSENLMKWSGSSFATAVASALNAKAKTPTEQADGKKWWLDKPLNCGDIEELLVG